jgi:hypothetical protein
MRCGLRRSSVRQHPSRCWVASRRSPNLTVRFHLDERGKQRCAAYDKSVIPRSSIGRRDSRQRRDSQVDAEPPVSLQRGRLGLEDLRPEEFVVDDNVEPHLVSLDDSFVLSPTSEPGPSVTR